MANNSRSDFSAIILAAGLSSRMGDFKPMLFLGQKTFLERLIILYQSVGIHNIFVITGHRSADIRSTIERYNVNMVHNEQYMKGMFSSVVSGVKQLYKLTRYFFIHPVDIPLVRVHTLSRLLYLAETTKVDVIYPVFYGKRAHPPLISIRLKDKILNWKCNGGLKQCLKEYQKKIIDLPVADQNVLMDANTKESYKKLILRFDKRDSLTPLECFMLMKRVNNTPEGIIKHCQIVSRIAVKLAKKVNDTGEINLDIDLIKSSALIHDIARRQLNHDKVAEKLLRCMGYLKMADIVGQHMNMNSTVSKTQPITETEIVYIADKLVHDSKVVNLNTRFKEKMQLNKGYTISQKITNRLRNAYRVKKKIEVLTCQLLGEILN